MKAKADAAVQQEADKVKELEDTLSQIEDQKKLGGRTGTLSERDLHAAEDDDFLQALFQKYAINGKNGIKMI